MKKVLVVGGSYFIGKHVVTLLKETFEVYVLNRGTRPFHDAKVNELVCDRNDAEQLKKVLSSFSFNYIVDISGYTKDQSVMLLDALNLNALETFVYISTSAVYNQHDITPPFKEDDALGGESPFKAYAKNKIESEMFLLEALEHEKLVIFRPPIVYGEDNYILRERLAFHLIEHDLPIYIPASDNHLSFVYVKDLAHEIKFGFDGMIPGGIYNIGNQKALSFTEWANLCAKTMGKSAKIVYVDAKHPSLDVRYFFPFFDYDNILSVEKIKRYSPNETSFEVGLKNAYQDYLSLSEPIVMPDQMIEMRKKIYDLFK
jgi:nucleoside-diphosphate-sugar epimerase